MGTRDYRPDRLDGLAPRITPRNRRPRQASPTHPASLARENRSTRENKFARPPPATLSAPHPGNAPHPRATVARVMRHPARHASRECASGVGLRAARVYATLVPISAEASSRPYATAAAAVRAPAHVHHAAPQQSSPPRPRASPRLPPPPSRPRTPSSPALPPHPPYRTPHACASLSHIVAGRRDACGPRRACGLAHRIHAPSSRRPVAPSAQAAAHVQRPVSTNTRRHAARDVGRERTGEGRAGRQCWAPTAAAHRGR